jgi:hypothetical protein
MWMETAIFALFAAVLLLSGEIMIRSTTRSE